MHEVSGIISFDDRRKAGLHPSFSKTEGTNELTTSRIISLLCINPFFPAHHQKPIGSFGSPHLHILPSNSAEGVPATKLAWVILTQDWQY